MVDNLILAISFGFKLNLNSFTCNMRQGEEGDKARSQEGGAYLKYQIINAGMMGHASAEHTRLLGGSRGMLEICYPQFAGNVLKLTILPLPWPHYFVSF